MGDEQAEQKQPGPLAGVRVLDFTRVLAGPFCTRMLSDLGADVVKVEPPDTDFTRGMGRRINGLSGYFTQQNVGKRNVCLDLRQEGAAQLILDMVQHVDVVVQNFRPGIMDAFGLGDDALRERNPRLIICHISGFGQDSPEDDKRAFAGVLHAMCGLIHYQAQATGQKPTDSAQAYGDTITGSHALASILAALYQRERTGRGQSLDIAMHDVMLGVNEYCGVHLFDTPDPWRPYWGKILEGRDGYLLYAGDAIYNFEKVLKALDRPEMAHDPRFLTIELRHQHEKELFDEIEQWIMSLPSIAEAEGRLEEAGLPSGRVRTLPEALASEHAAHRNMICEVSDRGPDGGTVKVINSPYKFSDAHTGPSGPAAYRGEHNPEILKELIAHAEASHTRPTPGSWIDHSQRFVRPKRN